MHTDRRPIWHSTKSKAIFLWHFDTNEFSDNSKAFATSGYCSVTLFQIQLRINPVFRPNDDNGMLSYLPSTFALYMSTQHSSMNRGNVDSLRLYINMCHCYIFAWFACLPARLHTCLGVCAYARIWFFARSRFIYNLCGRVFVFAGVCVCACISQSKHYTPRMNCTRTAIRMNW